MKKNNGGYALPFALVVILVLGLVAAAILSYSLNNYVSQKTMTQRMIDKCVVQGELEKVQVLLEARSNDNGFGESHLVKVFENVAEDSYELTEVDHDLTTDAVDCLLLEVTASQGSVSITCVFRMDGAISRSTSDEHGNTLYNLSNLKVTYDDYRITTPEGGGADE